MSDHDVHLVPITPLSTPPYTHWENVIDYLPVALALIDRHSGRTLWINQSLRRLLGEGVGITDVRNYFPFEYLPNLPRVNWEMTFQNCQAASNSPYDPQSFLVSPEANLAPIFEHEVAPGGLYGSYDTERLLQEPAIAQQIGGGRLQFVHEATRNIAYWEWSISRLPDHLADSPLLLTVHNITEMVMNERQLATAVRSAHQSRRDSEALGGLAQLLNRSLTTPDLLRNIVHQTADYFRNASVAVLLCDKPTDGNLPAPHTAGWQGNGSAVHDLHSARTRFRMGYNLGLEMPAEGSDDLACIESTLGERALQSGEAMIASFPFSQGHRVPRLASVTEVAVQISSPICQNGHNYGVIEVYFDHPRQVPLSSLSLLTAFSDQAAIGLHKADLYTEIVYQRAQLRSIFDHTPVGIVYFDADGMVVTANSAAQQTFRLDTDDLVGQKVQNILPELPEQIFSFALRGEPFHASHVVSPRPTGNNAIYDLSLVPVYTDGRVTGLLALSFEVTELVQARHEADVARGEAEDALAAVRATQSQMVQMEKMRAVGELAQGVAHDINNALMAVLGYADLALEELDDPTALENHLTMIHKAATDASSTVQRLNKFARRGIPTHGTATDLNDVVEDVIQMTRPRWRDEAHRAGIQYFVQADLQPLPLIVGEPSDLREVLINMIHNALNAMPNGGTLTLYTRPHGEHEVEIEIKDTGTGMSREVMHRIFDPFFTTRNLEGTGLGLAVSWSIVQRHGGKIDVTSEPGIGSSFFIRLPIATNDPQPMPDLNPLTPVAILPGVPILIVEDEPIVGGVLSSILSRHGYRVTLVQNGKEALEQLHSPDTAFEVVMTDHGMPGMNGLQLIAEIKRIRPDLPVLLLTGWGATVLETNVIETPPDAVLGKPINQTDLIEAISRIRREAAEKEPVQKEPVQKEPVQKEATKEEAAGNEDAGKQD